MWRFYSYGYHISYYYTFYNFVGQKSKRSFLSYFNWMLNHLSLVADNTLQIIFMVSHWFLNKLISSPHSRTWCYYQHQVLLSGFSEASSHKKLKTTNTYNNMWLKQSTIMKKVTEKGPVNKWFLLCCNFSDKKKCLSYLFKCSQQYVRVAQMFCKDSKNSADALA